MDGLNKNPGGILQWTSSCASVWLLTKEIKIKILCDSDFFFIFSNESQNKKHILIFCYFFLLNNTGSTILIYQIGHGFGIAGHAKNISIDRNRNLIELTRLRSHSQKNLLYKCSVYIKLHNRLDNMGCWLVKLRGMFEYPCIFDITIPRIFPDDKILKKIFSRLAPDRQQSILEFGPCATDSGGESKLVLLYGLLDPGPEPGLLERPEESLFGRVVLQRRLLGLVVTAGADRPDPESRR